MLTPHLHPGPRAVEPPADVCPECQGLGWKVVADGGAGAAAPCDCRRRERGPRLLEAAGIPERYGRCRLSNFNTRNADPAVSALLLAARKASERYVESFFNLKQKRFRSSGLLFVGPPGVGKTHLAAAVLSELVERYEVRARFVDFTSLLHQIQTTFDADSQETKARVLAPVIDAQVLALDELGAQKPTPWVMETLYLIINTRYTRRLPTLFTTNYRLPQEGETRAAAERPEQLAARLSPPVVSRLYEMARPITLDGLDYRREVKIHQHQLER